jgi:RHS repeat-associated protein
LSLNGFAKQYFFNGRIIARRAGLAPTDTLRYLAQDHLGSTSVSLNSNGTLYSTHRYDPWGKERWSTGLAETNYMYTNQWNDANLGLYNYNARYYDPAIGKFISADIIVPNPASPQSFNRYSYTRNNPVNLTDPTGHRECDIVTGDCSGGPGSFTPPEPTYFRDHKGTDNAVILGRELTESELLLVTLVVFVENRNASYRPENMTLSAWVYINQSSTKPHVSVFDAIDDVSQTWRTDPSFVNAHIDEYGPVPNDPAGQEEWVLNVASGYMNGTGRFAEQFQALRNDIVEGVYNDWREYGTNSSADPTHGAVFGVNRGASRSSELAVMFAHHAQSNPEFSYVISNPNWDGSIVVVGNDHCAYSQSNCQ